LFNNQGLVKRDFRAALALIRVAESSLTAFAYYRLRLFARERFNLLGFIVPGLLIRIPLGGYVIRHVNASVFRRGCRTLDRWVVGWGWSRVLIDLKLAHGMAAYIPFFVAIALDIYLYHYVRNRRSLREELGAPAALASAPQSGD